VRAGRHNSEKQLGDLGGVAVEKPADMLEQAGKLRIWGSSSEVERRTCNARVMGAIPICLHQCTDSGARSIDS
jgi:hypothetical protein